MTTSLAPDSRAILLAGPTAVGKSEIALLLAERLAGEIISVDSMQVYQGLDIGTAKATPAERARMPHHLIDIVEITEPFDAVKFSRLAHQAVAEIQSREHVPILCGGTGLYFKAFLEGVGDAPGSDQNLRVELEATPLPELLQELERRDPMTFEKIDRQNPRRVIRAVEVIRLTGKPFFTQRSRWSEAPDEPPLSADGSRVSSPRQFFCLTRQASDLYARINARVDEMFARGLVDETRDLLNIGLAKNKTALQAIGYRQVVEHLRGERSLEATIDLVKSRTRQFAKRQMTWFRKQAGWRWIELAPNDGASAIVERLNLN